MGRVGPGCWFELSISWFGHLWTVYMPLRLLYMFYVSLLLHMVFYLHVLFLDFLVLVIIMR